MPLRLIFMGTPDFAVPTLEALKRAGHEIAAVYTRAAKPAGRRGLELQPSPVERKARELGLPVLTPKTLKDEAAQAEFRAFNADAAVVVAYGLILPKPILDAPRLGCFNVHASLLPRWRGAAPIHRAVMAGGRESGVTIMKMDEGLDTGPIVRSKRVRIKANMTTGELHDELAILGASQMLRVIASLEHGSLDPKLQPTKNVSHAAKISKEEARISWAESWKYVRNHINGLSPFPGAWFEFDGARVKVVRARRGVRGKRIASPGTVLDDALTIACGEGAVRLTQVQRAGAKAMSAEEFLRGTPLPPGTRLA